jgi:hypothetical protein
MFYETLDTVESTGFLENVIPDCVQLNLLFGQHGGQALQLFGAQGIWEKGSRRIAPLT